MKLLWQQILGMLLAVTIALAVITARVEQYVTHEIEQNRLDQLMNYGRNIVSNNFSREDLVRASQLLASEKIQIQVYLPNGRTIYPTYDQKYNAELSQDDLKLLQSDEVVGFRTINRLNQAGKMEPFLMVYFPHHDVGQFPDGFISLGAPFGDLESRLSEVQQGIYSSFLLAISLGILVSIGYAWLQTRKIERLRRATREIVAGNYDISVDTASKDELGDLARDFDAMARYLQSSNEEIRRQEDLRRQFFMDAAHEMKTPLTTMSGLLEGLQNNMIPENYRERSIELVAAETARLTRLVNENLDYEKIRNNQYTLTKRLVDGEKLFAELTEQMSIKAREKGNWIDTQIEPGLKIWADYDRLRQILINLLTNAVQFAENSPIFLTGKAVPGGVELAVADQGIGIDADDIKHIWERFYKADISRKNTKFGESGIGLAVVHSLVEAHRGRIQVTSAPGEGTTFTLFLPDQSKESKNTKAEKIS